MSYVADSMETHAQNYMPTTVKIKLCPREAQICTLALFCDRDLWINPMTLTREGDLDILQMYTHSENEAASLRHSQLRA